MESLVNFATGVVLISNVADGLVSSNEKGREQTKYFVHKSGQLIANQI